MEYVRIPKDRVAVLIGKNGEIKRELEERTGAKLNIDSETGEVEVDTEKVFEAIFHLTVLEIIRAIGRGITPEKALRLLQDGTFTPVGGTKEILSGFNSDFLFRDTSPEAMADGIQQAIKKYYHNNEAYALLRQQCRQYVEERYSWERHVEQLGELISGVVGKETLTRVV